MKYCTVCKTKYDDSVSFCSLDGEVLEADPASLVDTVLDGQYQMEALLGKGGMGAVYRARHILLGDRVAIKVLPPEVRTNAEWLRRFRREGQAARRFRHPNAVTVYDLRTAADGTIYMVMEYVEGHTLDAELKKRGQLSAKEAFEILSPIMSVLDTAHSMGVVHRDLKPENIMIGNPIGTSSPVGPVVKLLDLGIAKMREIAGSENSGNTALTMAGQVLGTPYYMSPEQWGELPSDGNIEIDGRADIYSLGLVFYELIAGRRCYAGNTLHELRREHVSVTPKTLSEVVPSVPIGFSDAIRRATAKDRADRQPTAAVLAEELKAGLETAAMGGFAQASNELAETITIGALKTDSDVNAPTVIGLDASRTSVPVEAPSTSAPVAAHKIDVAASKMPDQTLVESASMVSSVTLPSHPARTGANVLEPPRKGKTGLVIGLVLGVVLLLVAAITGVFVYTKLKRVPVTTTSTQVTTAPTNAAPVEISRYWLMLEPADTHDEPMRVAGLVPVASGQAFQMHFVFAESGYVYIFGPGENNRPTAFLTTKPSAETGLESNHATAGTDFTFPSGDQLLRLDKKPGTDQFTVIFSKTRLESPSFLSASVTGDPLPSNQLAEFNSFVTKYSKVAPSIELDNSNNQKPFVRVKGNANQSGEPFVFEVRIQHN
jgi:eukaryotic-like serine/threonine-protein kinase